MPLLILIACLFMVGCSSQRILEKDQLLLSTVKVESTDKHITTHSIKSILRQRPNNKWFGVAKAPLGMYCLAGKNDSNFVCNLLRRTGEPPVVYDDNSTQQTITSLNNYLVNKGFRQGYTTYDTTRTRHKLHIKYKLHCGPRTYIRNISSNIQSADIERIVKNTRAASVLRGGIPFEINKLYEERNRIISELQNSGYYRINKDYVTFTVDTIQGDLGVNLTLNIVAPTGTDTAIAYTPYRINKVNVYEDCTADNYQSSSELDGIQFYHDGRKSKVSKRVYRSLIALRKDSIFSPRNITSTNNSLNSLSAVSFSTLSVNEEHPYLNYDIYVRKAKPHSISFEVEGTNTAGDLGAAAAVVYTNRNLFRGSELFKFKVRGAFEAITGLEGYSNHNYSEYMTEASISIPRLLIPFNKKLQFEQTGSSEFGVIYNMQERPEFHRRMLTGSFSYKWKDKKNENIQHKLDLVSINYIFMPWISSTFRQNYLEGDDPRYGILRYSYENLFIMNSGYSFIMKSNKYNNHKVVSSNNSWQFKFNLETAGNLLYLIKKASHAPRNANDNYELFNIEFAQYTKMDLDFVKSYVVTDKSSIAFHSALGIAIPYGNSTIIPYEKRYFSGGANSVRGWSVRELGPGSYKGTDGKIDFINQTGNLKFDLSVEYRTYLFWKLYGAAFVDAGNIWNLSNYSQTAGQFTFKSFHKEIAVAYGLGLRLNLDYFVLRFDGGMKAIKPTYPTGKQHYPIINPKFGRDFTFHFAVGMPF